jgi:hypothetical protein
MVTVKRRGGGEYESLPYARTPEFEKSSGFGSATRHGSGVWTSPVKLFQSNATSLPSSTAFYPKTGKGETGGWLLKIIYTAAVLSWAATRVFSKGQSQALSSRTNDAVILRNHMDRLQENIAYIESRVVDERRHLSQLKKTRSALQHEIKIITAVETTTGSRIKPAPRSNNEQLIKGWLTHRKDSLLTKIYDLQRYLQASSRLAVIREYV